MSVFYSRSECQTKSWASSWDVIRRARVFRTLTDSTSPVTRCSVKKPFLREVRKVGPRECPSVCWRQNAGSMPDKAWARPKSRVKGWEAEIAGNAESCNSPKNLSEKGVSQSNNNHFDTKHRKRPDEPKRIMSAMIVVVWWCEVRMTLFHHLKLKRPRMNSADHTPSMSQPHPSRKKTNGSSDKRPDSAEEKHNNEDSRESTYCHLQCSGSCLNAEQLSAKTEVG
ncbi:hypothetical protein CEXT_459671 [Caerostris extrusa]|uniref:Uncharacterized protein n=1 Tax=Caerostris extrusa TaxID=172846 RepID=A0AAV4QWP4_CAEEX|nr:hypothetical protein CEXT_459671 [Caerostris extrusa]